MYTHTPHADPFPPDAHAVLARLRSAGHAAYFVGGCVRDMLRGTPSADIDLSTSAAPDTVRALFSDCPLRLSGLKHGTVTVIFRQTAYEITTFRTEHGYSDSRRPDQVDFIADIRGDLSRRDFTVNAIAYAPDEGLVDPFHGEADLRAGLLRAVGEPAVRFREDALRILRALRFSSVLGFTIEPATDAALRAAAPALTRVARERLTAELIQCVCGAHAARILETYADVLRVCFPLPHPLHVPDSFCGTPPDPVIRFALLFETAAQWRAAAHRLTLPQAVVRGVSALLAFCGNPPPGDRVAARYALRAFCAASAPEPDALFAYLDACSAYDPAAVALCRAVLRSGDCIVRTDLQIRGGDLAALGVPPGPQTGALLDALLDAVMRDRIPNTREALRAHAVHLLERIR